MRPSDSVVSVVVTTKNEEKNISNCLASIKGQSYPQELIDIIVVDNNSQDQTKEKAKKFTDKVFDYGPERSAQRNFGIRKTHGKYILFLDADMYLSVDLIAECVELMETKKLAGLYIPERIVGKSFWAKVRDFERSFYNETVIDCVRFITKENFLILNGFDEAMSGPEDWDFDRRIRKLGSVGITKNCIFHNEMNFNMGFYIKKKMYYSKSFNRYIEKWGRKDPEVKKQLGAYYRLIGVFVEDKKWTKIIKHPMLMLGVFSLRSVLSLNYLLIRQQNFHF